MIELRDVNKISRDKKREKTDVLKNINVRLGEKGLVFILGENNSTLLNVILGLSSIDSGEVIINDKSTKDFKFKDFEAYRYTYTGFIFQDFNLLKDNSVYQSISFALEIQDKIVDNKKIDEILKKFEIDNIRNKKMCELSSYEKVKVSIVMALVKNPAMLFVRDDLENFDSEYIDDFYMLLKVLSEEKLVIVVSQDKELAKKYASRIIELKDGSIVNDTNTLEDSCNSINTLNLKYVKLPFRYRFKWAIKNLFSKRFKLVFSMLLIIISLTFFGLTKVVESFDLNKLHIGMLVNNNEYDVILNNYDEVISYEDFYNDTLDIYDNKVEISEDIFNYAQNKTDLKWYKEFTFVVEGQSARFEFPKNNMDDVLYYQSILPISFVSLEDSDAIPNLIGSMPILEDEIVISSYVADNIINGGICLDDENETIYKPKSYEQIILDGKYIKIGVLNKNVRIVGIIENDLTRVSELKDVTFDMTRESDDYVMVYDYFLESLDEYSRVFVSKDFIDKLDLGENNVAFNTSKVVMDDNYYMVPQLGYISNGIEVFDGNDIVIFNSLRDNEVIIDINLLNDITNNDYKNKLESYSNDDVLMFTKDYIKNSDIINRVIKIDLNGTLSEYVIKGVSLENNTASRIYYAKDKVSEFVSKNIGVYSIFTKAKTREDLRKIFEVFPIDNASTLTKTKYSFLVLDTEIIVYQIKLFGEASILLLVLGILLLGSVLMNNMNYWIKDLRKLALSGYILGVLNMIIMQVFSLIIICLLFSSIGINVVINLFNNYINTILVGNDIKLLVYGSNMFIWLVITVIVTIYLGYGLSSVLLLRKKKKSLI